MRIGTRKYAFYMTLKPYIPHEELCHGESGTLQGWDICYHISPVHPHSLIWLVIAPSHPGVFHVLDPLNGLSLGVDHERPACSPGHQDTVLCRERVAWETADGPLPHLKQHIDNFVCRCLHIDHFVSVTSYTFTTLCLSPPTHSQLCVCHLLHIHNFVSVTSYKFTTLCLSPPIHT